MSLQKTTQFVLGNENFKEEIMTQVRYYRLTYLCEDNYKKESLNDINRNSQRELRCFVALPLVITALLIIHAHFLF